MKKKIWVFALALALGGWVHAAFINDPAPDFSLPGLDGKQTTLSALKGEVVFVNFWASWCPPCKQEFPELNELANEYKGQGARIIGVNLDKSVERIEKFFEKIGSKPTAMTILRDPDAKVVARYVARSMPSSFVVDRKGVIRFVHFGYSDKDPMKWRAELDQLIKEGAKK